MKFFKSRILLRCSSSSDDKMTEESSLYLKGLPTSLSFKLLVQKNMEINHERKANFFFYLSLPHLSMSPHNSLLEWHTKKAKQFLIKYKTVTHLKRTRKKKVYYRGTAVETCPLNADLCAACRETHQFNNFGRSAFGFPDFSARKN
jgi:hypothetical protein